MNRNSRIQNSIINLITGFGYRIIIMFSAFIVRTVFIKCLNEAYLGVNGLYSDILSMLSLAELGFSNAIVFSMYEPLAKKDYTKLRQLMVLYRRVYFIVGSIILALGLSIVPFLDLFIKNKPDVEGLTLYYLMFLGNTVLSYWCFAYRNSILQADQRQYIISNYQSVFTLIKSVLQIILLIVFHSFTIYLVTQMVCTILQNLFLALRIKKEYPIFDHTKAVVKLSDNEVRHIFKDVKALVLSKVSHVVLNSTDSLIISAFVGINWVGLLSNYIMVTEAITGILSQLTGAIQASLGNFFAQENKEAGYRLFKNIEFLNFWLYGFSTIAFIVLLNPFITIWIGPTFKLPQMTVIAISVNFFVAGFMNTLWTFRSTLGLFTQGQYRPIIVAFINVVLSILLSYPLGITGVLIATSIARASVNLWYDPWMIHKKGFGKSVKGFYISYLKRIGLMGVITFVMWTIAEKVVFANGINLFNFVVMVVLTGLIPNLIFLLIYNKTDEYQYFRNLVFHLFREKIKKRK